MSTGQGQGRLTEGRRTLSQADSIAVLSKFYGKATATSSSPRKAKSRKKPELPATAGDKLDRAIDLSDTEIGDAGGEALATVLGLPARIVYVLHPEHSAVCL